MSVCVCVCVCVCACVYLYTYTYILQRTGMAVHLTRALLADPDILILSDPVVHHTPDEVRSESSLPRPVLGLPRPPSASLTRASARACEHPSSYHGELGPERP